jgi:hypothetical protein
VGCGGRAECGVWRGGSDSNRARCWQIFHPGAVSGNDDILHSWSEPYFHGKQEAQMPAACSAPGHPRGYCRFTNTSDEELVDGAVAVWAQGQLKQIQANRSKGSTQPFFLGVGFHKPCVCPLAT